MVIRSNDNKNKKLEELAKTCDGLTPNNMLASSDFETLGHFAGGIAHDFNNILSIIEGYTEIAVKRLNKGELTQEHLEKVLRATERGAGITRQLLAFGRQNLSLNTVIDIVGTIKEQEHILRVILGEEVTLDLQCSDTPLFVECSKDNIVQILTNLAINARDAMSYKGIFSVQIDTISEDNQVRLRIQDDGSGMSEDVREKVFQPFFTTKESGQGTGLGLSFVYGIVEQMNGSIKVCSQEGVGTRFEIILDISDKKPETSQTSLSAKQIISADSLEGRTILVAEDEPDLLYVLEDMFGDMGMNVLSAGNGNEALLVQEDYMDHIDFLLTDVVMPEMHGAHLAEMFTSLRPDTHVVFMSGYPSFGYDDRIHLPEGALLISKPLREEKLSLILQQCLAGLKKQLH